MNEIKLPPLPKSFRVDYDDIDKEEVHLFSEVLLEAYARAAVEAATAPLRDRIASLETALHEWLDKTEWVQQTCRPRELGLHRADVLKARIAELETKLAGVQKDAARYRWLRNDDWDGDGDFTAAIDAARTQQDAG